MSTPINPQRREEQFHHSTSNGFPIEEPATTTAAAETAPPAEDRHRAQDEVLHQPAVDRYTAQPDGSDSADAWQEPVTRETVMPVRETTAEQPVVQASSRSYGQAAADLGVDRESVVAREKEQFGGIKIGSAFFGWVAAAGIAVLLTSLLTAAGVVLSLTSKTSTADITNQAAAGTGTAKTVGLVGAILLLVVLFVAYYCGGYVAARMARFNGTRQGLAVWLWGIVFAIIIFILVKVAGSKYNILTNLNLPRIPVDEGSLTATAAIAIAAIIIVTLGAALLGGLAGMHFHRKVDRAGLTV